MQKTKQPTQQQARYAVLDGYIILDFARVTPAARLELAERADVRYTNTKPVNDRAYSDLTTCDCCWYSDEG